jgi:hypothetical protein
MAKGLLVHLLRAVGYERCSNNGITGFRTDFVLTGPGCPELFDPTPDTPELRLQGRMGRWIAVPVGPQRQDMRGPMFGGNFVFTSDSRMPNDHHPIPVHDRWES